jgi:hypothetical protein
MRRRGIGSRMTREAVRKDIKSSVSRSGAIEWDCQNRCGLRS